MPLKSIGGSKSDFAVDTVEPVIFFGLVADRFSSFQNLVWILFAPGLLGTCDVLFIEGRVCISLSRSIALGACIGQLLMYLLQQLGSCAITLERERKWYCDDHNSTLLSSNNPFASLLEYGSSYPHDKCHLFMDETKSWPDPIASLLSFHNDLEPCRNFKTLLWLQ